ncbi:MAG: hypothetical protein GTO55_03570 [Armatimonadetes bacterium]|nr:hypothetical protein [Armatimonadota bacterium]NIM23354.1 hypothetical protein [Armatimonadota bacterium]NIM67218.1 hypothetical protein [Armatimonadota bacterium]NIN05405.1 hypothetical protein [Armatimonadota bacterium]NIO96538.1 hypothetical protein [Armatimonadota bacterium]
MERVGEAFVEVVSSLLLWVREVLGALIGPFVEAALTALEDWLTSVETDITEALASQTSTSLAVSADVDADEDSEIGEKVFNAMFRGSFPAALFGFALVIVSGLTIARVVATIVPAGKLASTVADLALRAFVDVLITLGAILLIEFAALAILYSLIPEGDPFWQTSVGEVTLPLSVSLFNLMVFVFETNAVFRVHIVAEAFGLFLGFLGLILSFGITGVPGKVIAALFAGAGLAIVAFTPEATVLPFPFIEELLAGAMFFTALARLLVELA